MSGVTKEEQKKEALERMKEIGIFVGVIGIFEREDRPLCTRSDDNLGGCFDLEPEVEEMVKDFEKDTKALVYHVVITEASYPIRITGPDGKVSEIPTPDYKYISLLYVAQEDDEWSLDREDIKGGQALAYVINETDPELSEYGAIGIKMSPAGGVFRTW